MPFSHFFRRKIRTSKPCLLQKREKAGGLWCAERRDILLGRFETRLFFFGQIALAVGMELGKRIEVLGPLNAGDHRAPAIGAFNVCQFAKPDIGQRSNQRDIIGKGLLIA